MNKLNSRWILDKILIALSVSLMSLGLAGLIYVVLIWIKFSVEFWLMYWQTQGYVWTVIGWKGTRKYYAAKRSLGMGAS